MATPQSTTSNGTSKNKFHSLICLWLFVGEHLIRLQFRQPKVVDRQHRSKHGRQPTNTNKKHGQHIKWPKNAVLLVHQKKTVLPIQPRQERTKIE